MHSFIIAAVSDNGVIGAKGDLVWNLPADQAFFFERIKDAQLITGRLSFESNHGKDTYQDLERVIVITTQDNYKEGIVRLAKNMDQAWQMAQLVNVDEVAVLGGTRVYEEALHLVDTIYITEVHAEFEGDTFFPPINGEEWQESDRRDFPANENNPYPYSFVTYRRK